MEKRRKYGRKILSCLLALTIVSNAFILFPAAADEGTASGGNESYPLTKPEEIQKSENYGAYLKALGDKKKTTATIKVAADSFTDSKNAKVEKNYNGYDKPAVSTSEDSYVEYTFTVPEDAFYQIEWDYCTVQGKNSTIKRKLEIDGEVPFYEALSISFYRTWEDNGEITQDQRGNDVSPGQKEVFVWTKENNGLRDSNGYYDEPYKFFLTKGEHTIRMTATAEPVVFGEMRLTSINEEDSYANYLQAAKDAGAQEISGDYKLYEAEKALYKSSSTLYPVYDKSSPATSPSSYSKLRMNTIGGSSWQYPGSWISWEIDVPESGLYRLTLKARQNISSGFFSSRILYIDDAVPFKEARSLRFTYDDSWQMITLGDDENGEYLFYFDKPGKHTIKLESTLGGIRDIILAADESLTDCNEIYRQILMLTGSEPDLYRDYKIGEQLPGLKDELQEQQTILEGLIDQMLELSLKSGESISALEKLNFRMKEMIDNIEKIPSYLADFKNCLTSYGTWLVSAKQQPLELDYLLLTPQGAKLPKANANFFSGFGFGFMSFVSSYFEDYTSIGDTYDKENALTVWIGIGRDQATIAKKLTDKNFTPTSGIGVNLSLVNMATSLLPATLAGRGPDVALQVAQADVVNYALRGAATELNDFPEFDEVMKRYYESAIIPFSYMDKTYGLAETQTFPMLFYRKDIMAEMGIEKLDTWDDIYHLVPQLQKKYFTFGLPVMSATTSMTGMGIFLYQRGGTFYRNNDTISGLDSEIGMAAFKQLTEFYTNYESPTAYDFATRFRVGEMPVAITDYTMYNLMSIFAPEIEGLWSFVPVPGTVDENGNVNRSVPGTCTGCMILGTSEKKDQAWEFIKWWTSTENQVDYGRELENVMGVAARYATANIEAMKQTPWTSEELAAINAQWQYVKAIPEVPGGYYTARQLDFAWRSVVVQGNQPRDTLYDYAKFINQEIYSKRKEFGLPLE